MVKVTGWLNKNAGSDTKESWDFTNLENNDLRGALFLLLMGPC